MLHIAGLAVAASLVVGQVENKVPEDAREQMAFLVGDWTLEGEMNGQKYKGTYSARWTEGRDSLILTYRTDLLSSTAISGWDPSTQEIVENWYSPTHGRLELRYDVSDNVWKGTSLLQNPDGSKSKGTIRLEKHGNDGFTYTEQGDEISVTNEFHRVVPNHEKWIKYLEGTWTVTNPDETQHDESIDSVSDGNALVSRGKFADGIDYVRVIGWHADSKELVESWYLSDGVSLVNRYNRIDEKMIAGRTSLSNTNGESARGTVIREKVGEDELKSTYRGTLPGQKGNVEMVWIAKRKPAE